MEPQAEGSHAHVGTELVYATDSDMEPPFKVRGQRQVAKSGEVERSGIYIYRYKEVFV